MSKMNWMLVLSVLAAGSAACSKDESTEPDYVQPGASEGDEVPPDATEPPVGPSPLDEPAQPTAPSEDSINPPAATPEPNEPTSSTAAPLKNEEIVHITGNVDAAEIEQAKLAKSKAQNAQVKKFATHMISEHTKSKNKGAQLAKSAELKPEESALGEQLATKAARTYEALQAAGKDEFDGAYISAQVKQHQEVLDLLDRELIPNASEPELKAQLQKTREMVERHLGEGQRIQQSLAGD